MLQLAQRYKKPDCNQYRSVKVNSSSRKGSLSANRSNYLFSHYIAHTVQSVCTPIEYAVNQDNFDNTGQFTLCDGKVFSSGNFSLVGNTTGRIFPGERRRERGLD